MVYLGLSPVHIILNTPTVYLGLSAVRITLDLPAVYFGLSPGSTTLDLPTVYLGLSPVRTILDLPIWSISVYRQCAQLSICQRFISVYRQFVFLSGVCATTDVGRTSRREFTLVREVRTTAVSRRLRKTYWCFYSVFVFQSTHSSTHSFSVIIGLALCACIFGVSCMAPLPKE